MNLVVADDASTLIGSDEKPKLLEHKLRFDVDGTDRDVRQTILSVVRGKSGR